MVFGEANIAAIGLYFLLFSVGLTTNSLSIYKLIMARHKLRDRRRMMTLLLIHLAVELSNTKIQYIHLRSRVASMC